MKSILFICPYFGTLPKQHMELWLQSCSRNPDIDWLVLTDDRTVYDYPENVRVKYISFQKVREKFQEKFEFSISLETPYKLCDFKPTYGYVFSEYLDSYDFWGHCDMSDCIFGNLRKFLGEKLLNENDKIGFLGHMSLYRNREDANQRFLLPTKSGVSLKQILGVRENRAFDELTPYSINTIYKEYQFPSARIDEMYVDVSPMRYAFQASVYDKFYSQSYEKKAPMIFMWRNGKLFEYRIANGKAQKREIGYVHFQKREMKKTFAGVTESYYIVPNQFISRRKTPDIREIEYFSRDRLYPVFFKLKWEAVKYHVKKVKNKVRKGENRIEKNM